MKQFHIHVSVDDLQKSVGFYSALFGTTPTKLKPDYAKWMLDDPRVNFAISTRSAKVGIDHLGIQTENEHELKQLRDRMSAANISTHNDGETTCCYAKSEKSWVEDPSGIAWEAYHTMEDAQMFSGNESATEGACCTPETKGKPGCCVPSTKTAGCC